MSNIDKQSHKIALPVFNGFKIVKIADIIRCQANGNFTEFIIKNYEKIMISRSLKFYETLLADYDYLRIHKSHLINLHHVISYEKGKLSYVELSDNTSVEISAKKRENFLKQFNSIVFS